MATFKGCIYCGSDPGSPHYSECTRMAAIVPAKPVSSDGTTASYYELPAGATELQHLISHKDMNAQLGEIFRESYRYGEASHCDKLRGIRKIRFYANAEEERLEKEIADGRN